MIWLIASFFIFLTLLMMAVRKGCAGKWFPLWMLYFAIEVIAFMLVTVRSETIVDKDVRLVYVDKEPYLVKKTTNGLKAVTFNPPEGASRVCFRKNYNIFGMEIGTEDFVVESVKENDTQLARNND